MKDQKLTRVAVIVTIIAYAYLCIAPHFFMKLSTSITSIMISTSIFPIVLGAVLFKLSKEHKHKTGIKLSIVTLLAPVVVFGLYFLFH